MAGADLFDGNVRFPLAELLRPTVLQDVVGQPELIGPGARLSTMVERGTLASLILWGPPGVGKTSIARLLANAAGMEFHAISAVFSGVADLKRAFDAARARRPARTLLFVDEVHRFNRAQQDGFLPVVEDGTITLVGATTENPSFTLNGALLSRCQVVVLHRLDDAALETLLQRAERMLGPLPLTPDARASLCAMADGDGRYALNMAEQVFAGGPDPLDPAALAALVGRRAPQHDRDRDGHYNLASALHKSLRGSDPDAALYWLARALAGGEDPRFLARRMVRFASEDIGLADSNALLVTLAAKDSYDFLGSPEGELAIAHACLYLATAPKSNAAYVAHKAATRSAKETGSLVPPANILNAPTKLVKTLGYGKDYAYDHDAEDGFSGANYWPEEMAPQTFYRPTDRGHEKRIAERLAAWAEQRGR